MEKYGEGAFIVTKVYYDSPREDCNGYYESEFRFATLKEAIKAYYDWREHADPTDPVGFYTNFAIPRDVRIKHDDLDYAVRTLGGRCVKIFPDLRSAVTFCKRENTTALHFYLHSKGQPELRAKVMKDYRCRVYII